MEWLQSLLNWIAWVWETGLVALLQDFAAYVMAKLTLWKIQSMIWLLDRAWAAANIILDSVDFSAHIEFAWGQLPPDIASVLFVLGVGEIIIILITALVTRFVLSVIRG